MKYLFSLLVLAQLSWAGVPNPTLELNSTWGRCSTGTFKTPINGGWSRKLVTSEWNGAPWSCLSARIRNGHPRAKFQLEMRSEWRSGCLAGRTTTTGFTGNGGGSKVTGWSKPVVTSEWNGSPWSCLSVRLRSKNTRARCRVSIKSRWGSCSTRNVRSTDGQWSDGIITSEWNGSPWSCLQVKMDCKRGARAARWVMETAHNPPRELDRFGSGQMGRQDCRRALRQRQCVDRRNRRAVCVKYKGHQRMDHSEFGPLNCRGGNRNRR